MPTQPPPLLLVTHYFPAHGGGIELVAGQIGRLLAARRWPIEWFASDTDPAPQYPGVTVRPQPACNGIERAFGVPLPVWSVPALGRLVRAVRSSEVVHIHDGHYPANLLAALAARAMRKRLVVTQHVGHVPYRNPLLRLLLALVHRIVGTLVLKQADAVLFVSPLVRKYFERLTGPQPTFLDRPNGVDTALFAPADRDARQQLRSRLALPADRPVLLFVGRHVEKKGLDLVRELAESSPGWQWCLIGDGPVDPSTWGLANVRALGRLAQYDIVDYYRAADVMVLPSVGEGFPLVVQEAISCGVPVAVHIETRDAGELPDAVCIAEDVSGDDAAVRWRRRLTALLGEDAHARGARHEACRAFALEHWSWEATAEDYAKALACPGPRRVPSPRS